MARLSAVTAIVVAIFATGAPGGAQQVCDPDDPTLLKPDLQALAPADVRVVDWGGNRRVTFTTSIGNKGDADLVVRGQIVRNPDGTTATRAWQKLSRRDGSWCEVDVGEFELHPTHRHWHFEDFADYEVRRDDPFTGEVVGRAEKISFCLLDMKRLPGFSTPQHFITGCASQAAVQGISVGFADVYETGLPGQFVDLDADPSRPVLPGTYYLVNVANPLGRLMEKDTDRRANAGYVAFTVMRAPRPSSTPTPTVTPLMPTPTATAVRPTATPVPPPPTRTPRFRATRVPRPTRPPHMPRPTRPPGPRG